ncbi:sulfur relay protein, TusE/DsrC/DsvC family [secondary endosymbiont of Heteropsylla cubana]|uniref:Sulfurtransferase n=1 Tax=secondary endosymbiont of Heteropsylla cubana TaxID=134287 RepID=J3YSZ5_9ENTR|nr:TusE/DsrC/DsvC family sulfur relay protein [secondary endosymbiont of Heteropsylla cubana]AFP85478.1 sulfur relay protein, TusE/DsrC/DsvC family [secondary endosymbiont of Heteropsylla cubana]
MNINYRKIKTDSEGYLIYSQEWSKYLAEEIARRENITLSKAHWEVIYFIREFYYKYNTSPTMRMLVKCMEKTYGPEKGNSLYLFHLFPQGPAKQATKIAGLPKPVRCL